MQWWAGSASVENRDLPFLASQNPVAQHGAPTNSTTLLPVHTLSPLQICPPHPQPQTHTHTHSPLVLAAPLPAYQKYARQNNGCFIHRKTGMCLNVAARVSLFSLSTLCVPHFP